jgi:hypothetical protein
MHKYAMMFGGLLLAAMMGVGCGAPPPSEGVPVEAAQAPVAQAQVAQAEAAQAQVAQAETAQEESVAAAPEGTFTSQPAQAESLAERHGTVAAHHCTIIYRACCCDGNGKKHCATSCSPIGCGRFACTGGGLTE